MNQLKILVLALVMVLTSTVSTASRAAGVQSSATTQYGVEIIIFRVSNVGAQEDWRVVPPGRGFGNSVSRGGASPTIVKLLPSSDYHLANIDAGLKGSGAWHPIAHAAWIQTAATRA
jgi:hypothetical protein